MTTTPRMTTTTGPTDAEAELAYEQTGPGAPEPEALEEEYQGLRRLVPTTRQRSLAAAPEATPASGAGAGDGTPAVPDDSGTASQRKPRKPLGTRVREYLASINPAGVEGPKLPLLVLGLSAALGGWSSGAIGLAAPEIQATFGASVAALTLVSSITSIVVLVLGLPLGYLVDRVSRVMLVRISAVLAPIGDVMQALSPNFGVFTLGSTFTAISGEPAAGADLPLMADYYRAKSRARVFGILAVAGSVGGLISAPIVGVLVANFGWRQATLVLAVMSTTVALLTFLLREPRRGATDRLDMGVDTPPTHEAPPPGFGEALRGAWGIKTLRLQAIASFVATFAGPLNILIGLVLASKFALGPVERSLMTTLTAVLMIPATLISVGIADRLIDRKPSSLVALQAGLAFLSSGMLVAQAFAPNLVVFFIFSLVPAMLATVLGPVGMAVMSLVVPARYRGVGMQVFTPFAFVGLLLAPVLVQVASQVTLQQAFLFFSPFLIISGLIYLASAGTVTADIARARASAVAEETSLRQTEDHRDHLLVCRGIEASIDGAVILRGVDLDVHDGEILALVGTNGAGKSTLLTTVCGLVPATNGAVFYDGRDITYRFAHEIAEAGVGYLPGGKAVFGALSVAENLRLAQVSAGPEAVDTEQVLATFPVLAERLHTPTSNLSGGEQQMLALAQTFIRNPRLLLIDELSLGLAPDVVESLLDSLRKMNAAGTTIVMVEQSLNIATEICDRLVYMDQGRVAFEGSPAEFLNRPELVRSLFMGSTARAVPGSGKATRFNPKESTEPVLRCADLRVDYGGIQALAGIDLQIGPREIVGIIGANGAGKTTLFDALSGYETPSAGTVELLGHDITHAAPDARARMGLSRAFQDARLFGVLSVRDTIALAFEKRAPRSVLGAALWLPGVTRKERELSARVDELIDLLNLGRYADAFIGELSTGTRRAVELACHMAAQPQLLLLDEPSSGLAQAESEALGPMLTRMVRDIGTSLLVIEHDMPLITSVADRLIAMERGQVIAAGPPAEVLNDPRVRAGFMDASETVIRRSGGGGHPSVTTGEK